MAVKKDGTTAELAVMNALGLSTQMPNMIEIYTNNERARVRDVSVGKLSVRLRRGRTDINRKTWKRCVC